MKNGKKILFAGVTVLLVGLLSRECAAKGRSFSIQKNGVHIGKYVIPLIFFPRNTSVKQVTFDFDNKPLEGLYFSGPDGKMIGAIDLTKGSTLLLNTFRTHVYGGKKKYYWGRWIPWQRDKVWAGCPIDGVIKVEKKGSLWLYKNKE